LSARYRCCAPPQLRALDAFDERMARRVLTDANYARVMKLTEGIAVAPADELVVTNAAAGGGGARRGGGGGDGGEGALDARRGGRSLLVASESDDVKRVAVQLNSGDWRERLVGLEALASLCETQRGAAAAAGATISDELSKRLGDGNAKVALAAAEVARRVVSALGASVDGSLPVLLPALFAAMQAPARGMATAAGSVVDDIVARSEPRLLLPALMTLVCARARCPRRRGGVLTMRSLACLGLWWPGDNFGPESESTCAGARLALRRRIFGCGGARAGAHARGAPGAVRPARGPKAGRARRRVGGAAGVLRGDGRAGGAGRGGEPAGGAP
jgi:hypothetical protein